MKKEDMPYPLCIDLNKTLIINRFTHTKTRFSEYGTLAVRNFILCKPATALSVFWWMTIKV